MKGAELIKRVRALGRRRKVPVRFDTRRGKGSHGFLYFDGRRTVIKDRRQEIGAGLLNKILRDLGLSKNEF